MTKKAQALSHLREVGNSRDVAIHAIEVMNDPAQARRYIYDLMERAKHADDVCKAWEMTA